MFIVTFILAVAGLVGLALGRLKGYGRLPERPYRRIYGDAPGAWPPGER